MKDRKKDSLDCGLGNQVECGLGYWERGLSVSLVPSDISLLRFDPCMSQELSPTPSLSVYMSFGGWCVKLPPVCSKAPKVLGGLPD